MKFEAARIHFLNDVFVAVAVVVTLALYCKKTSSNDRLLTYNATTTIP